MLIIIAIAAAPYLLHVYINIYFDLALAVTGADTGASSNCVILIQWTEY